MFLEEKRKREMSSFDLLMLRNELNFLAGGRIQKIFQKGKQLRFEIFVSGKGVFHLLSEPGKLFVSEYKREASNERFSQYLRKHLGGQRITSIRQAGFERIVEIETEKSILVLELFSKGNAILCDRSRTILMPLERQEWRDRKIATKMPYKYPPSVRNPFVIEFEEFRGAVMRSEKNIASFLATDMSLSGKYAEEVCERAAVDRTRPCNRLTEEQVTRISLDIKMLGSELKPNLIIDSEKAVDFSPIEMQAYRNRRKKYYPTFMHALDDFFSALEKEEGSLGREISEIEGKYARIIEMQKADFEKWGAKEAESRAKGEFIQNNIEAMQKIIGMISELRRQKKPWDEIKAALKGQNFGGIRVREIKEKEGTLVVEAA